MKAGREQFDATELGPSVLVHRQSQPVKLRFEVRIDRAGFAHRDRLAGACQRLFQVQPGLAVPRRKIVLDRREGQVLPGHRQAFHREIASGPHQRPDPGGVGGADVHHVVEMRPSAPRLRLRDIDEGVEGGIAARWIETAGNDDLRLARMEATQPAEPQVAGAGPELAQPIDGRLQPRRIGHEVERQPQQRSSRHRLRARPDDHRFHLGHAARTECAEESGTLAAPGEQRRDGGIGIGFRAAELSPESGGDHLRQRTGWHPRRHRPAAPRQHR